MAVELDPLGVDEVCDLMARDGAEEPAALAGLDRNLEPELAKLLGGRLGLGAGGAVALLALVAMPLPVGDGALIGDDGGPGRQQEVAAVTTLTSLRSPSRPRPFTSRLRMTFMGAPSWWSVASAGVATTPGRA